MSNWHDIGTPEEFGDGTAVAVQAGGQHLAVFRLGDELHALHDKCSHGNARLTDGYIENGCVECPLHQGLIDIRSGLPLCAPITVPVRSFPVRVVAGRVEVGTADAESAATVQTACDADAATTPRQVEAVVDSLEKLSDDVMRVRLRPVNEAPLIYYPGQYLDVLLEGGHRRSYSMATAVGDRMLELHIRHMPGGRFTDQLFNAVQPGHRLALEGPAGDFYLRATKAPVILLASGTGFAPLKALVEQAIRDGNTRAMQLYWGGRRRRDLYMDTLCHAWAKELPWFEYIPVLSSATSDDAWTGRTGNVHLAVLEDHADLSQHEVYACGAPVMVETAREAFTSARSLPSASFYADSFLSQADLRPRT